MPLCKMKCATFFMACRYCHYNDKDSIMGRHECEYCGHHFQRSFNLKRHLEQIHNRPSEDVDLDSTMSDSGEESFAESEMEWNADSDNESNADDESETESNTDESVASSDEEMNDDEWSSYTDRLDSLMMKVYRDTYDEVTDEVTDNHGLTDEVTDDDDEAEDKYPLNETVMNIAKKRFKKRLINIMIISCGLQRDTKYKRLFTKVDKYLNEDVDLHLAIPMAIKSSSEIIYNDFHETLDRLLNDGNTSMDVDSSSSGEESSSSSEESSSSDEEMESD